MGFPQIYNFGKFKQYYWIVMELLGPSLGELHRFCNKKFSLKTTI